MLVNKKLTTYFYSITRNYLMYQKIHHKFHFFVSVVAALEHDCYLYLSRQFLQSQVVKTPTNEKTLLYQITWKNRKHNIKYEIMSQLKKICEYSTYPIIFFFQLFNPCPDLLCHGPYASQGNHFYVFLFQGLFLQYPQGLWNSKFYPQSPHHPNVVHWTKFIKQ